MLIAALLVNADNISFHDEATSKKRVIENLSRMLAANTSAATAEKIFQVLLERERLGSTGLGKGVAIPHARVPDLTHTVAAMLTLETPVEFEAADGKPIDIAFGLLVPEDDTEHHLQHLSRLVTLFRDEEICSRIRQASSAEAIFELLLSIDEE
ncbi:MULTISPECIES: PTS sugar transporter subunit IIA [unclassified Methylophaga]|jgi:nitrogen PTS system EIIA component|uniref:PTS sugar transporter subunit IIA n=1 Tax=unclassified Methylophaga TaxID=2629249 RepID=UPI000C6786C6|nr:MULTISPECIES: PTS sugar transporter subunit IIA [unclassified Methylophaga]MAL49355.1 PTS sugar transporter subunit IIA [Methylophaga sp.]MAP26920.1 PTS sugar transporter subunit IIA [Methylophaga sp.]MBP23683.1 PTS sugar transporter subunit IIA [Methylophaga sp.]MDX1750134.1 PTS sugar transporter subunit IIA [Methylophaga sp.]HAD32254.1 PTS sugar transporter subunit IIA [Methylophaga sp.]|tara:strand:- start:262 stop:723 length:462 start_codon:yes stop_codon:yes gene_type:complete